jgi:hypothetical protein
MNGRRGGRQRADRLALRGSNVSVGAYRGHWPRKCSSSAGHGLIAAPRSKTSSAADTGNERRQLTRSSPASLDRRPQMRAAAAEGTTSSSVPPSTAVCDEGSSGVLGW